MWLNWGCKWWSNGLCGSIGDVNGKLVGYVTWQPSWAAAHKHEPAQCSQANHRLTDKGGADVLANSIVNKAWTPSNGPSRTERVRSQRTCVGQHPRKQNQACAALPKLQHLRPWSAIPTEYPSEPVQPSVVCTAECVAIHHGVRCEAQHKFHNDQSTPGLQFAVWQCIGGWTKTSQPGQALQIACWLQCGVNSNCWTDRDQGLCECEI